MFYKAGCKWHGFHSTRVLFQILARGGKFVAIVAGGIVLMFGSQWIRIHPGKLHVVVSWICRNDA